MSRISDVFAALLARNEHPLIGYTVAGYPDAEATFDVARAMVNGGVDILELGIPFSDPIADGPTIQAASYAALQGGMTPTKSLQLARQIKEKLNVPLAVMTYCNILYKPGFDSFMQRAKASGVDGVIIADLTFEDGVELKSSAAKHGIDTIFLVSPNTTTARIRLAAAASTGFLYLVSVFGTTGERTAFEDYTVRAIQNVKKYAKGKVPVAVGFGVSREEHVRFMINAGADAVIVGSAFTNTMEQQMTIAKRRLLAAGQEGAYGSGTPMLNKIESLARSLKSATRLQTSRA